jgi:pheromone shutdown protein TraB
VQGCAAVELIAVRGPHDISSAPKRAHGIEFSEKLECSESIAEMTKHMMGVVKVIH